MDAGQEQCAEPGDDSEIGLGDGYQREAACGTNEAYPVASPPSVEPFSPVGAVEQDPGQELRQAEGKQTWSGVTLLWHEAPDTSDCGVSRPL
jgi:hypothetical protein